jgi:UV DNA damage endonuclease
MIETLRRILATWPEGCRPKIHFSSPRTEMREVKRKISAKDREKAKAGKARPKKGEITLAPVKATARVKTVLVPPVWTGHADFTNPFEFSRFMRDAEGLEFDVMMEGKAKDISLLKLKPDLLRYAPDVAARFGIFPADAAALAKDEAAIDAGVDAEAVTDDADPDEAAPLAEAA